jgi:hypothetical protein
MDDVAHRVVGEKEGVTDVPVPHHLPRAGRWVASLFWTPMVGANVSSAWAVATSSTGPVKRAPPEDLCTWGNLPISAAGGREPEVSSDFSAARFGPRAGRARHGSYSHNGSTRDRGGRGDVHRRGAGRPCRPADLRQPGQAMRRPESPDPGTAVRVHRVAHDDALQLAGPAGTPGHTRKLGLKRNLLAR